MLLAQASELSISLSWFCSFAVTYIFPYLQKLGLTTLFFLLAEIQLMYFIYMYKCLPGIKIYI